MPPLIFVDDKHFVVHDISAPYLNPTSGSVSHDTSSRASGALSTGEIFPAQKSMHLVSQRCVMDFNLIDAPTLII